MNGKNMGFVLQIVYSLKGRLSPKNNLGLKGPGYHCSSRNKHKINNRAFQNRKGPKNIKIWPIDRASCSDASYANEHVICSNSIFEEQRPGTQWIRCTTKKKMRVMREISIRARRGLLSTLSFWQAPFKNMKAKYLMTFLEGANKLFFNCE